MLNLGTMTFGGTGPFAKVGSTDLAGARWQINLCLDTGVNLIDTADIYSAGLSEEMSVRRYKESARMCWLRPRRAFR